MKSAMPTAVLGVLALLTASCATNHTESRSATATASRLEAPDATGSGAAYASTYQPKPSGDIAIINATLLTAAGPRIDNGRVIISNNRIVAVGPDAAIPANAHVIDATGKWVTPGIIDGHSHVGATNNPEGDPLNEMTDPNTAQLLIEHSLWTQSPEFPRMAAAGVTTELVLPGSANILGGRGVVLKNTPANTIAAMKFPGAPYSMKLACGENPTGAYGAQGRAPMTLAGSAALLRSALLSARAYLDQVADYQAKVRRGEKAVPPTRDLRAEAIADVLQGKTRTAIHCYRAEDMATMLQVAHEFGFHITAFHHGTEAFKIIPLLKAEGVCILTWGPDWGGFKMEAYDHSDLTPAMLDRAGVCVAITSDSSSTAQHLNVDAARSMAAGNEAGLQIDAAEAIRWITLNPARVLGVAEQTGSLEAGKMADVVIWNREPFSVYAYPEQVLLDGVEIYERGDPRYRRSTDFELDQSGQKGERQ